MLSSSPNPQNSGSLLEEYLNHSQVQSNPAPGQLQQDTHTAHHTHTHTPLAHRGTNRCLTLLVIKEMETKTPLNLRLAKTQNRDSDGLVVGRIN